MKPLGQTSAETIHYKQPVIGDTLVTGTWSISPVGPLVTSVATTSSSTTCAVSGVVAGTLYTLTCLLTVTSGQVKEVKTLIKGE